MKKFYDENPEIEVIKAVGWFYLDLSTGAPNKKDLDIVISDKPVMIYSGDMHSLWINSKALEMAMIYSDTEVFHK